MGLPPPNSKSEITPEEAAREHQTGRVMLVDVRDHDEWSAGHAPGAVHAPLSKLKPESFPSDAAIIAVCHAGGRSTQAMQRLTAAGLSVRNITGGMSAWADAGLPVTRDDGTPGTVG